MWASASADRYALYSILARAKRRRHADKSDSLVSQRDEMLRGGANTAFIVDREPIGIEGGQMSDELNRR